MAAVHDASYKLLFSHRQMIQSLLQGFVPEDWVARLDFATLEKVPASFIADGGQARHGDLIWRVRGGPEWLYVYLMLEFQSGVEPHMALRMMSYLALFYQDLLRQRAVDPSRRLPPVLPLVLYRGAARWRAPRDVADLIAPLPGGLARYRPGLRYLLLDQAALARAGRAPLRNLAAAFFRLEHSRTPADLAPALRALADCTPLPEFAALRRDLVRWLEHVLLPRHPADTMVSLPDIQEMQTMLAETVEGWKAAWKREGLQEGREEGRVKGREEGRREVLARQLVHRFGPLPAPVRERLANASPDDLDRWATRLLDAGSLSAVFTG